MHEFLKQWKLYFTYAGLFSLFVNLLQLTFPIYMFQIYDRVLSSYSLPTLLGITGIAMAALVVLGALDFVRSRLLMRAGIAIDQRISGKVLNTMLREAAVDKGSPARTGLSDLAALRNFLTGSSIFAFFDAPWTPIYLLLIFFLHPMLGLVATLGGIVIFILGYMLDKYSRKPLEAANLAATEATNMLGAGLRNAEVIQAMGMRTAFAEQWTEINRASLGLQVKASSSAGLIMSMTKVVRLSMQVMIYGVGAYLAIKGDCSPGAMIAASIVMGRALQPIEQASSTFRQYTAVRVSYGRLRKMLTNFKKDEGMDLPVPLGVVEAKEVSFGIDGRPLLQNINFSLQPGEALAVLGPSAAGKSTLTRLLTGVWPLSRGTIRIDKADLFQWDREKLGRQIGYLPQDVELFAGTVAENIARLEEVDADKVVDAAMKAGCHEALLKLAKGYDTEIGEGGAVLSGGQRQMVGLARAMYGDPRVIILDEPSSNLDEESEKALVDCIARLRDEARTVVVVTHKPMVVSAVDKVLVLKDGKQLLYGPRDSVMEYFKKGGPSGKLESSGGPKEKSLKSSQKILDSSSTDTEAEPKPRRKVMIKKKKPSKPEGGGK